MTLPYIFFNFHEQIFLKIADNPDKFFEYFLITQPDFLFSTAVSARQHMRKNRDQISNSG